MQNYCKLALIKSFPKICYFAKIVILTAMGFLLYENFENLRTKPGYDASSGDV